MAHESKSQGTGALRGFASMEQGKQREIARKGGLQKGKNAKARRAKAKTRESRARLGLGRFWPMGSVTRFGFR